MTVKEYKGVKYKQVEAGKFKVRWPSGLNGVIEIESEEKLKEEIDKMAG